MTYRRLPVLTTAMLLLVACGLWYLHDMDIIHKNVQIVRSCLHLFGTLLNSLRNILVDACGHAHLGGLGAALLPPDTPGVDIERFFCGAAPELADGERFGSADAGATKASDAYAFGVLAWEVSIGVVARY